MKKWEEKNCHRLFSKLFAIYNYYASWGESGVGMEFWVSRALLEGTDIESQQIEQ